MSFIIYGYVVEVNDYVLGFSFWIIKLEYKNI